MRKEVLTQYPGVYKIKILDAEGKWGEPIRGKKFTARRNIKKSDGSSGRVKRSFDSLAEAKAFCKGNDIEEEVITGVPSVVQSSEMTFGALAAQWVQNWLPSVNIVTQLRYKRHLKHLEYFSRMDVSVIQPAHIDAWIAHVKAPGYLAQCHSTRCSYEHEFKVLRAILNYYSSRCNRNYRLPFLKDHLKMLKIKEKPVVKKDLTIEQLQAFLDELKKLCWGNKWECIYYLAAMQYAIYSRIQEPAALYVEDFDLVNNRLEVKRKVQWIREKGYKALVVAGSKTNGGKIFSPIPELAVRVFNEWKMRSGVRTGLLFQIDGEVISYRQIQYKYDHALKNAKLPFTATHILRHASLAEAYSASHNILAVQKLAGHASIKTTEKYAKARDEQIIEVQNRMDAKLSSLLK